jgi:hypothetical protein
MEMNPIDNDSMPKSSGGPKWWVWTIIAVVVCCCLTIVGIIGVLSYFGREPENVSVEYEMPSVVKNGQTFDLILKITNSGNESITVEDIDLDEALGGSILDGSVVLETEPDMERDYSVTGLKTFYYKQPIGPGETKTVTFHLQATTVGEYGGSIGIYVGGISKRIDYIGIIVQE